jgi:hypothetical protein
VPQKYGGKLAETLYPPYLRLGFAWVVQGIQVSPRTLGQTTLNWVIRPVVIGTYRMPPGRTWVGHCPLSPATGPNFSRTEACPMGGLTPIGQPNPGIE